MIVLKSKIGLRNIVLTTLLAVGVIPVVITGWLLSNRSSDELRAAEGRYQIELVRAKANRIELFGERYMRMVNQYAELFEFAGVEDSLLSKETQKKIAENIEDDSHLLALFVKPVIGESLSAYRAENISQKEIEAVSGSVLSKVDGLGTIVSQPLYLSGRKELVLAFSQPIREDGKVVAAVVAIASLQGISKFIDEAVRSEKELLAAGAPIVFVVDQSGRAVFHPDMSKVENHETLKQIRIVDEWMSVGNQIQTALLPFSLEVNERERSMIGAYSTAVITEELEFGVIVMQDQAQALASVQFMRAQVWIISAVIVLITLVLGLILARMLTTPIVNVAEAAREIASGNFNRRIITRDVTEIGVLGKSFNLMVEYLVDHMEKLEVAAQENRDLFVGTVKALAAAIDGKDHYTRGHSERVSRVSVAIGQRLGLDDGELEKLRISSLLHDVGKIGIDDAILKKPAKLTDEEFALMRKHPHEGYKIMKNIPAMKDFLPGMYMHHEMVNGKGYPQGLTEESIPLQAKIVSVADAFDAMTIDRPYQKGEKLDSALKKIESFIGTRYDEKVVQALIDACTEGQIGVGTVKLKNFRKKKVNKKDSVLPHQEMPINPEIADNNVSPNRV